MMYTTFILACSLIQTGVCTELRDTLGPYPTQEKCIERAVQMSRQIAVVLTEPHEFSYKCVKGNNT